MDKYSLETGLNRKLQPVLVCSPDLYDELIAECRAFFEVMVKSAPESMRGEALKKYCRLYPAIGLLAQQPMYSEIAESN